MAKKCKFLQKLTNFKDRHFDVVFCFEDRVFEAVIDDYLNRDSIYNKSCHVINLNTTDNAEEAEKAGELCAKFCMTVMDSKDWEDEMTALILNFEEKTKRKLNHVVFFD
jgi:hypothetical protein